MDWFLYDDGLRRERLKILQHMVYILLEMIGICFTSANAKKGNLKTLIDKDSFQFSRVST